MRDVRGRLEALARTEDEIREGKAEAARLRRHEVPDETYPIPGLLPEDR